MAYYDRRRSGRYSSRGSYRRGYRQGMSHGRRKKNNGRSRGYSNPIMKQIDEANRLFGELMETQGRIERYWRDRKNPNRRY